MNGSTGAERREVGTRLRKKNVNLSLYVKQNKAEKIHERGLCVRAIKSQGVGQAYAEKAGFTALKTIYRRRGSPRENKGIIACRSSAKMRRRGRGSRKA